jgi:hypothetical protein
MKKIAEWSLRPAMASGTAQARRSDKEKTFG